MAQDSQNIPPANNSNKFTYEAIKLIKEHMDQKTK
jgi:hypothetical protein